LPNFVTTRSSFPSCLVVLNSQGCRFNGRG
jgi:hypothetical protein